MAAAGSTGRKIQSESDEIFEFNCSSCKIDNRNREATKFCINCQDFYCSTCVDIHGKVPFMKCHTIVEKAEFPTNVSKSLMTEPTDMCPLHPKKLIDMYCRNDDKIGCSVCMAVKHRSCIDVIYIPEEICNLFKEGDLTQVLTDLTQSKLNLKDSIKTRQNDLEQIENDSVVAVGKIKDFRRKINITLDQMEKATVDVFESNIKGMKEKARAAIEAMNTAFKDVESCQQQLESAEKNQSQQFVCLKKGQQKLSETEKLRRNEAKSSEIVKIKFDEDRSIEVFLNKLNTLGNFIEMTNSNLHQVAKQSTPYKVTHTNSYNVASGDKFDCNILGSCIMTSGNILLTDNNNKKLKQLHGTTYKVIDQCYLPACPRAVCEIGPQEAAVTLCKVTHTNSYNVASGDKFDCNILGSCIMTSGDILLTDNTNKKLKQLHGTTYKVIDQCDLPACPRAVCEIGPQEAAVTLNNRTIQVVSMGSKMTLTRTIQMNHGCYGLAFSRGEMFVSNYNTHVYVYDTSGTLLRTISKDQLGGDIFSDSRHIAISDDGNTVYVTDYYKGVFTLDRHGRVLSRFTDPELNGVLGICIGVSGSVLVCANTSQNVIQIGPSGNKLGVIANTSHGISYPKSVCYDRSHSRMIVTNYSNCNTVLDLVPT